MQHYFKKRIEKLEKNGPTLSLIDIITYDDKYINWYMNIYGSTPLMKLILED